MMQREREHINEQSKSNGSDDRFGGQRSDRRPEIGLLCCGADGQTADGRWARKGKVKQEKQEQEVQ